jgi:fructose-1,6-bisphosphatase
MLASVVGSSEQVDRLTPHTQYIQVMFDPLDGSSNIDVNGSIGSIFAVSHRLDASAPHSEKDALQVSQTYFWFAQLFFEKLPFLHVFLVYCRYFPDYMGNKL